MANIQTRRVWASQFSSKPADILPQPYDNNVIIYQLMFEEHNTIISELR